MPRPTRGVDERFHVPIPRLIDSRGLCPRLPLAGTGWLILGSADGLQDRVHPGLHRGGLWLGRGDFGHLIQTLAGTSVTGTSFAVALIFVSFAYSGWNAVAYLGGEIRRPGRNLPLALALGTLVVIALYLSCSIP